MQAREITVVQVDMTLTEMHALAEALTRFDHDRMPVHHAVVAEYVGIAEQYLPADGKRTDMSSSARPMKG